MAAVKNSFLKRIYTDPTAVTLILSNLLTIFVAVIEDWSLYTVLLIYWFQGMVMVFFLVTAILTHRIRVEELPEDDYTKIHPLKAKTLVTGFTIIFYSFFLLFCLSLILNFSYPDTIPFDDGYVLSTAGIFFVNHFFSFLYNKRKGINDKIFYTYFFGAHLRVMAMGFTCFLGIFIVQLGLPVKIVLLLFLIFKVPVDVITHEIKHPSSYFR